MEDTFKPGGIAVSIRRRCCLFWAFIYGLHYPSQYAGEYYKAGTIQGDAADLVLYEQQYYPTKNIPVAEQGQNIEAGGKARAPDCAKAGTRHRRNAVKAGSEISGKACSEAAGKGQVMECSGAGCGVCRSHHLATKICGVPKAATGAMEQ